VYSGRAEAERSLTIGTQSPAYSVTPDGLEQQTPTPLVFAAIPARLRGWCLAPDFRSAIGWNQHSIFDVQVNHHPFSFVTTKVARFERRITAVHRLMSGDILVCLVGSVCLYSREDAKLVEVLALSTPTSYVRPQSLAVDAHGRLIIGEYGNVRDAQGRWISIAWIYWSEDQARSWQSSDVLIRAGVNKHVHAVSLRHESEQLFVTTGDNLKWVWSAPLVGPMEKMSASISGLRPENTRLMALGGFTGLAVTPSAIYWGTDYWMGSNFISSSTHLGPRQDRRWKLGGRLRRNPVEDMVSLAGTKGYYILAASVHQYQRQQARSGLLAFDERADTWSCLTMLKGTEKQIYIRQCPCAQGAPIALVNIGVSAVAVHEGAHWPLDRPGVQS
jgi:hypothetical protein